MLIVPILDIKNGQAVHSSGKADKKQIVEIPVLDIVAQWTAAGIKRLHIIDVDAMVTNEPVNVSAVRNIKQLFPEMDIEVSGGIYHEDDIIIWLDTGIDYIVLSGNKHNHITNLEAYCIEYPGKIMINIDLLDGQIVNQTLIHRYGKDLPSLLLNLEEEGVSGVILSNKQQLRTNVDNEVYCYKFVQPLSASMKIPIFLHGDKQIFQHNDILQSINHDGVSGLLMGREIYENQHLLQALIESTR